MTKEQQIEHLIIENQRLSEKIDGYEKRIKIMSRLNKSMFEQLKDVTKTMHIYENELHELTG